MAAKKNDTYTVEARKLDSGFYALGAVIDKVFVPFAQKYGAHVDAAIAREERAAENDTDETNGEETS